MTRDATLTLPRRWAAGLALGAVVGWLAGGFALGQWAARGWGPAPAGATPSGPAAPAPGGTARSPFAVGQSFPWQMPMLTLDGHPTTLAHGPKATVVLAMATWCLYCGYMDRYVLPVLARTPGVAVDVVDVSPQGGIADPGPATPPFSGRDGSGGPETVAQMGQTLAQYARQYGLPPAIHLYVAPAATQQAWHIQAFPTLAYVNARGQVVAAPPGAQTLAEAEQTLQQALQP